MTVKDGEIALENAPDGTEDAPEIPGTEDTPEEIKSEIKEEE
jgi:hypothetical protein